MLSENPWLLWAVPVLDSIAISRAVWRSGGVERTLAWVFAILALPGVGAVGYLLLASPSIRRAGRRKRRAAAQLRRNASAEANPPGAGQEESACPVGSIERLCAATTDLPPTRGNQVVHLAENEHAFAEIEGAILAARQSVWVEYYIVKNDETGKRFLEVLCAKAREGVEVRFLFDAVGSLNLDAAGCAALCAAGGRAEAFLPMNPLRRRWSVHLRTHRKMIIVDGAVGFTGGMNIGNEYSGRARKKDQRPFRDTHLCVRGPAVGDLAQIFAEDWLFASGERLSPPRTPPPILGFATSVAILPSGPDQIVNAAAMVYFAGVASAAERVYLASPYFVPDEPMIQALTSAALRGVDVRVMVPAVSDVPVARAAGRSYFPELVRSGVRVFQYLPSMLHAKTLVVDGRWGVVGSANVDVRSFRFNFEIGAVVFDAAFAAELEERFELDQRTSREVTRAGLARYGTWARLRDGAARLLSPVL